MANADAGTAARTDWPLSNPWTWVLLGLTTSGLALLWARVFGEQGSPVRYTLLVVGLLAAGAAVNLRLDSARGAFLDALSPRRRDVALLALALAGGLLALAATALVIAAVADRDIPWTTGTVLFLWLLLCPAGSLMAFCFFQRRGSSKPVGVRAESAVLLVLAAVCAFCASWALYLDNTRAQEWDTIRLVLAVLALVAFLAAPLVLLPRTARRVVVSILILLHFGGILNAVLSAPPSPWLANQVWMRFYRPYLQLMYLNNAYHFYAPEPGPSCYLWCRIEYERPDGSTHWHWLKVPELDDDGQPLYTVALQYQRRLALTENVARTEGSLSMQVLNKDGKQVTNPILFWRAVNSPNPPEPVIGQHTPQGKLLIPFHPNVAPILNQYQQAPFNVRKLLESYARHLAETKHPEFPEDKVHSVKIYKVIHVIADPRDIKDGRDPGDLVMYLPYYLGKFNPRGELLDAPRFDSDGNLLEGDPFLYWLLPILKENPNDPESAIRAYVFLHAGDSRWVRPHGGKEWVEER